LSNRIREIRKERGITQQQLSEMSSVPRVCITRYESGKYRPTLKNAEKLAAALHCTIEELIRKAG
jgi:putative transcriptional regulator